MADFEQFINGVKQFAQDLKKDPEKTIQKAIDQFSGLEVDDEDLAQIIHKRMPDFPPSPIQIPTGPRLIWKYPEFRQNLLELTHGPHLVKPYAEQRKYTEVELNSGWRLTFNRLLAESHSGDEYATYIGYKSDRKGIILPTTSIHGNRTSIEGKLVAERIIRDRNKFGLAGSIGLAHTHNEESEDPISNQALTEASPTDVYNVASGKNLISFIISSREIEMILASQETMREAHKTQLITPEAFTRSWFEIMGVHLNHKGQPINLTNNRLWELNKAAGDRHKLLFFKGPLNGNLTRRHPR